MVLFFLFEKHLSIVFQTVFLVWSESSSIKIDHFLSPSLNLGDPQRRAPLYNPIKQQYIIDRHIISFEAIINYYETGRLIVPTIYEPIIFFQELKYFQLNNNNNNETIQHFYKNEIQNNFNIQHRIVPWNNILRPIWISLEYDDYSFITQIVKFSSQKKWNKSKCFFRFIYYV